ncbi:IS481 family transposase [Rhizobium ruizarguesonis]|uniref:IS481 family transposase n=1 Tax=Rhizobium ruizarguesonis TaxID=2081791 RepID=UPI001CFB2DE2|nr:IS481 family transposase [Rhizobium ruizarguesonis]UED31225.1 IS481 family transposase [Rhizobium ruizarguesonis]
MNIHKNARLTPLRREEMALAVAKGQVSKAQASRLYGVSSKIVSRWVERFRAQGRAGMADRSSRPKISPRQTGQSLAERIVALRRQRLTGKHIAMETGVSPATVSRVLRRAGLSRMKDVDPAEPIVRYEYAEPGGLIHLDIKRLGRFHRVGHRITGDRTGQSNSRGVGWEYVHICIDDASRIAFTDIFPDETAVSAIAFLKAAVIYYQSLGITVTRVMTDNGACYKAKDFATTCKALGLKHIRTKPYTPKTNGKAERFIQTALREWAYACAYRSSEHRKAHLPSWTHMYNWHRPHGSLKSKTPISRLGLNRDNLLSIHI